MRLLTGRQNHSGDSSVVQVARWVLACEPCLLAIFAYAMWFPSPMRDEWVWVLGLWVVMLAARWVVHRRLWTPTLYDELLIVLLGLIVMNITVAPYQTRGIIMIYRPLFGVIVLLYVAEYIRTAGTLRWIWRVMQGGAFVLGVLGILAVNWGGREGVLRDLRDSLPDWSAFFVWEGGFNPNEIAGALVWLLPVCVGLALYRRYWLAGVSILVITGALLAGQSLSGLLGALAGVGVVLALNRRWYTPVLGLIALAFAFQLMILLSPSGVTETLIRIVPRGDTNSIAHRSELWQSAINIMTDHPLTGGGIAMYRHPQVRADYPTVGFSPVSAVHPHNELLQFGADFGLPGVGVWVALYVLSAHMLTVMLREGDETARLSACLLAGALVAHGVYGLADAIPIWDRFAFIGWGVFGCVAGGYGLVTRAPQPHDSSPDVSDT